MWPALLGPAVSPLPLVSQVPRAYRADRAQRNPMVAARRSGDAPLLVAARNNVGALFHDPPRTTLYRPLAGPCGLRSGMVA